MNNLKYWEDRSVDFDKINWTHDEKYIKLILNKLKLNKNDIVLDVGTGTGVLASAIAPFVRGIIGIDISDVMLYLARKNYQPTVSSILLDIRDINHVKNLFNKIVARMVFHHITEDTQIAMNNCYNLLQPNGIFCIAEAIPPSKICKEFFTNIFKLKEERLTFLTEDIIELMKTAGFQKIEYTYYNMYPSSVNNWLSNCKLSKDKQNKIIKMYKEAPDKIKEAYKMVESEDDIFILAKNVIITGVK
jgi:cyclopropane fatty-acyl-phospholipid synthase-like methyltransferase